MSSKIKKKSRKHKLTNQKRLPPKIKISEAILKLSEPLRQKYRDSHRTQAIISTTVLAWNISLFPKDEQVKVQEIMIKALPGKLGAEDVSLFLKEIDMLIDQKDQNYPNIREQTLNYQLASSGDKITLTVSTTSAP